MAHFTTLELSEDDIEALADIRMRLIAIAGPHLWPELLVAIVDDYLAGSDPGGPPYHMGDLPEWLPSEPKMADERPGYLLSLPRQGER